MSRLWAIWCRIFGHKREEKMTATICGRCRVIISHRDPWIKVNVKR